MVGDFYGFTEISGNKKTGKITVTKSNSKTCPDACAMIDDCYAKFHYLKKHWGRVDAGEGSAVSWDEFLQLIRRSASNLWRHDEMGDLPGENNDIDAERLTQLVKANGKKRGFTYTHKPVFAGAYVTGKAGSERRGTVSDETASNNRAAIKAANDAGFTVNLSADNLADADAKFGLNIAPVTVVLPTDAETGKRYTTPEGRKVVTCPAAIKGQDITCKLCKLCAIPTRKSIIGFPAHGAGKKRASLRVIG